MSRKTLEGSTPTVSVDTTHHHKHGQFIVQRKGKKKEQKESSECEGIASQLKLDL
jgi:hypothetical protein